MGTNIKKSSTFRMFVVPNFLSGMATAIDIRGKIQFLNVSDSEQEADFFANKSDWNAVREDFKNSLQEWENLNVS